MYQTLVKKESLDLIVSIKYCIAQPIRIIPTIGVDQIVCQFL